MADGIEPTEKDIEVAYNGLCLQHSTLKNIEEFLQQTARVIASERARCRELERILHERSGLV